MPSRVAIAQKRILRLGSLGSSLKIQRTSHEVLSPSNKTHDVIGIAYEVSREFPRRSETFRLFREQFRKFPRNSLNGIGCTKNYV